MSSYLPVKNFEILIEKIENSNIVYIVFKINEYNYFRFPYYEENVQIYLVENFKHIVNGKEKTIDLNFNLNYNLVMFQKDHFMISLMNENNETKNKLIQESRIIFENNAIVRNGLRKFIDDLK